MATQRSEIAEQRVTAGFGAVEDLFGVVPDRARPGDDVIKGAGTALDTIDRPVNGGEVDALTLFLDGLAGSERASYVDGRVEVYIGRPGLRRPTSPEWYHCRSA